MVHSYALRPAWTPITIGLMVLGFIFFWPLGLAMLAYILWGDRVPEVRRHFAGMRGDWARSRGCGWSRGRYGYSESGNSAFDDYRERELKRLDEERRKLEEERREFEDYVHNLRRARDREEFERFMRERRTTPRGDDKTIDL
jgi:hypothetical protein